MYLQYGSYAHQSGECQLVISKQSLRASSGVRYGIVERWQIGGLLIGTSPADLKTKLTALEAAYAVENQDVWLRIDGSTYTTHGVANASTLNGVHVVVPPAYERGDSIEHVTQRTYTIGLEWEIPYSGYELLEWAESIEIQGNGGADWRYFQPQEEVAQPQILTQYTPYTVVQSGTAVGYAGYPAAATPISSTYEHGPSRRIRYELPIAGRPERRTSWSYVFFMLSHPGVQPSSPI